MIQFNLIKCGLDSTLAHIGQETFTIGQNIKKVVSTFFLFNINTINQNTRKLKAK